jgi:hypothetical protein
MPSMAWRPPVQRVGEPGLDLGETFDSPRRLVGGFPDY